MSGHFKRGYKPLAKEAKRQEELRQQRKERLYEFFLKDDRDEADVRFLLEEPCNVRIHQVQRRAANGKHIMRMLSVQKIITALIVIKVITLQ